MIIGQIIILAVAVLTMAGGFTEVLPTDHYKRGWRVRAMMYFLSSGMLFLSLLISAVSS